MGGGHGEGAGLRGIKACGLIFFPSTERGSVAILCIGLEASLPSFSDEHSEPSPLMYTDLSISVPGASLHGQRRKRLLSSVGARIGLNGLRTLQVSFLFDGAPKTEGRKDRQPTPTADPP